MPVSALMVIRIPPGFDDSAVEQARNSILPEMQRRFSTFFESHWDIFYSEGPLVGVQVEEEIPETRRHAPGKWLNLNFSEAYYGRGYERGHLPLFVACAELLEATFPECEVWYGNDTVFESLRPFGPVERQELMDYYNEVGHTPYVERNKSRWVFPSDSRKSSAAESSVVPVVVAESNVVQTVIDLDLSGVRITRPEAVE